MRRPAAVLLLLLLGLVACGGDDRLSRDEFLEQADAICAKGDEELDKLANELVAEGEQPSEEDFQALVDAAVENVRGQLDDIEALSPPEDMEADVEDLIETARSEADELEDAGGEAITSGEEPFQEANAKASELGLEECGSSD